MQQKDHQPIILFDGICNLCNASVRFVLKQDKKKQFLLASLQSDAAKKLLLQYNYKNNDLNSIILIDRNKVHKKSAAIMLIFEYLGMPWRVFNVLKILPLRWLDFIYDQIAERRYTWFGKKDTCTMMLPKHKNRFIQ
jgi:predicted DCC family thiol-disulfide oxidoreductase YuxK